MLPEGLQTARNICRRSAARALRPEPELSVSQWSDENRVLSSKASATPGKWSTKRTPYLREIMDAMTPSHPCTDLNFQKGTQIGGSEGIYNAIGYSAHQAPAPAMLVMPSLDTAKLISQQRIKPMIDETPVLKTLFFEAKARDSANTILLKEFPGGMLRLTGANSGPGLRSMPVRFLYQDEVDAYPDDVGGEGDPCAVADKRTETFGARAKRIRCSSPKIKGKSRIERSYQAGTQARYYVPCPHCEQLQSLKWAQMRWTFLQRTELHCPACAGITEMPAGSSGVQTCAHCDAAVECTEKTLRVIDTEDLARVWYECEGCGQEIHEHHKTAIMEEWPAGKARHIHHAAGPGQILADDDQDPHAIWAFINGKIKRFLPSYTKALSYHVSALYSPLGWFSWAKAVRQKLEAEKGGYNEESGESLLQVFDNTVLGESYEIEGEQPKVNILKQRVELHLELQRVPKDGLLLTAFVDVQGDRIEVEVDAFGRGDECWTIDHQVIHGDPARRGAGSVWAELEKLREKSYPHAGGNTVRITAMGIDAGYMTQEVYDYCRRWAHRHVIATKGASESGKPILGRPAWVDVDHNGQKIKHGVQLWHIGTDTAKERFYRRLEIGEPKQPGEPRVIGGPGYQHFPRGLSDEYFEQIVSEKVIRRRVKGVEKLEWVKTRERNEALDLKIGCYAVAVYAGLQRMNWDELERAINPLQQDLFIDGVKAAAAMNQPAATVADLQATAAQVPAIEPQPGAELALSPAARGWIPRRDNWLARR